EGVARGESCLFVTLSETRDELEDVVASHGWSLDGITVVELAQIEGALSAKSRNTLFQPSEVELAALRGLITDHFDRVKPPRMALDSLSELRLIAQSPLRYRRQILGFKQHFAQS